MVDFYKMRILIFVIKILVLISWAIFKHDYWFPAGMSSKDPITIMRNSSQGHLQAHSLPLLVCFAVQPCAQAFYFAFHSFILCILFMTAPLLQGFGSDFCFAVRLFFKIYFFIHMCVSECMYVYHLHADTCRGQKRTRHTHFQTDGLRWCGSKRNHLHGSKLSRTTKSSRVSAGTETTPR